MAGESLEACLRREILEELGLFVQVNKAVLSVDHEYSHKCVSLHFFDCLWTGGEPQPLECDEFRWISPAEFSNFPFPPPDIRVVEWIQRRVNNKNRWERRESLSIRRFLQ